MPSARHSQHPAHRLRPDRHRPGLRVRLLRHAGAARRCRRRATRSSWSTRNPATIMTDPELADRTYIEPITLRGRSNDHRARAARRAAADARRADRPQPGRSSWRRAACSSSYGVELIGAKLRGDQEGRGPRPVQGTRWSEIGLEVPRSGYRAHAGRGARAFVERDRLAADHPAVASRWAAPAAASRYNREEFDAQIAAGASTPRRVTRS